MYRAFNFISKIFRPVKTSPTQTINIPTIKLVGFGANEEDEKTSSDNSSEYQSNAYFKASIAGIVMVVGQKIDDTLAKMISWGSNTYEKNNIKNRVSVNQYSANYPIEDRYAFTQLTSVDGFAASVFDGHGGWQLAEYASKVLHQLLDRNFKILGNRNPSEEEVNAVIIKTFDEVEQAFRDASKQAFDLGFGDLARVGSCALVTVVINNRLYVANSGDCKGILIKQNGEEFVHEKLNSQLNACKKSEQERLRKEFSDDDIVVCKKNNPKACYVKGRLMPTRSFGDFHLKHAEFNNPQNLGKEFGYRSKIENFKGPYITHRPVIKSFGLTKDHKAYILASDGLWDELRSKDAYTRQTRRNTQED